MVEFKQFEPISLSHLQEIVGQLKLSGSSMDAIPPFLLKQVFDLVGPYLLNIVTRCLETYTILEVLKHANSAVVKETKLRLKCFG